eukprot:g3046.t1
MISNLGHIKLERKRKDDENLRILQLTDIHYFHSKCEVFETKGRRIEVNSERYSNEKTPSTMTKSITSHAPEVAYFHIPLPQCEGLRPVKGRNGLFDSALRSGKVPFPWNYVPFLVRMLGKHRIVGSSKIESGMYDAIVKSGRILACFFGHDHFSDAVFYRDCVYFGYGRVSGFTPPIDWEGDAGKIPFKPGGRLVEISKTCKISTWIHNEMGFEEANTRLEMPRNRKRQVFLQTKYLYTTAAMFVSLGVFYQYYYN